MMDRIPRNFSAHCAIKAEYIDVLDRHVCALVKFNSGKCVEAHISTDLQHGDVALEVCQQLGSRTIQLTLNSRPKFKDITDICWWSANLFKIINVNGLDVSECSDIVTMSDVSISGQVASHY